MESHPLNMAHQQHRRAEVHLMNNRYDEAMQCHHNAAELLLDAMKTTTSTVALESITLQHSYHLKQKDLIKSKKEQYARVKKAMEHLKSLGKEPLNTLPASDQSKLQVAIYRAINETDSLLHLLSNNAEETYKINPHREFREPVKSEHTPDGKKTDKNQQTVVEELQILSQNLHSLVEQLVLQVEVLKDENMTLKERVAYLEKERIKYLNLPTAMNNDYYRNTFPNISIASDGFPIEPTPKAAVLTEQQVNKPNVSVAAASRPSQTHFDLSALKND